MFELTVENHHDGSEDLYEFDDSDAIKSFDDLHALFGGVMLYDVDADKLIHEDDFKNDDRTDEELVFRVIKARWDFAKNSEGRFHDYVQDWLNDAEISTIEGVLEGGILSGYTELVWNDTCREVFTRYMVYIETIIDDLAKEFGAGEYYKVFEDNGFSVPLIVQIAFEETLRSQIVEAGIEV